MFRVVEVFGPPFADEDVGGALHTLARQSEPDPPGDVGDGQRLFERCAEHLPPGGRQTCGFGNVFCGGQQLTVEFERRQNQVCECVPSG